MRTIRLALLTMTGAAFLAVSGCSSKGECNFDTDCTEPCQVCNQSTHKCEPDQGCQQKLQGECSTDADCDSVFERCENGKCVPVNPYGEEDGGIPDGYDGGEGGNEEVPDVCLDPNLDCSRPAPTASTSQGLDRDGDLWGECCDCDDRNSAIHPKAKEIIYNCKDDDCDPSTPDDDLDGDGFGSIYRACDPGSDCNDFFPSINPAAQEICDNVDNDCDGRRDVDQDGYSVCAPPECDDVSGTYTGDAACYELQGQETFELTQDGCNLYLNANKLACNGTLDPLTWKLSMRCFGGSASFECNSQYDPNGNWLIDCGQDCTFNMHRSGTGITDCEFFTDSRCNLAEERCGVVCSDQNGQRGCVVANLQARDIGFYCNPVAGKTCQNGMCHNGACVTPCRNDGDCTSFKSTSCQPITYTGCGGSLALNACVPSPVQETLCNRTADCDTAAGRVCGVKKLSDDVATACLNGPGVKALGDTCTDSSECKSNLCLCTDNECTGGQGRCSVACMQAADCPTGASCLPVNVRDASGSSHQVTACSWSGGGCGHDADCPVSAPVCAVGYNEDQTALETSCTGMMAGFTEPNPGAPCTNWSECYSAWCTDWPGYCASVCINDNDCPTYDDPQGTICDTDLDCPLPYRCDTGIRRCRRNFVCWAVILNVPAGGVDAVTICRPDRATCLHDADCRPGEVCMSDNTKDASDVLGVCEMPIDGGGPLGAPCENNGAWDCATGLCVLEGGGGPGKQYCSNLCVDDNDCTDDVDPDHDYICGSILTELPFGTRLFAGCVRN